jgi:hypothetical protein
MGVLICIGMGVCLCGVLVVDFVLVYVCFVWICVSRVFVLLVVVFVCLVCFEGVFRGMWVLFGFLFCCVIVLLLWFWVVWVGEGRVYGWCFVVFDVV